MFSKRSFYLFAGFAVLVLLLLGAGTVLSAPRLMPGTEVGSTAALDWYFAHDHAILDGDNNVVTNGTSSSENRWAPLDWYLSHPHAIVDGDGNSISR